MALVILAVILLLVVALWGAGTVAEARLAQANPPPGRLVDVGSFAMHIHCVGQDGPTVVLDAGLSDFSVFWALVQPGVAQFSRVCAYDRAGYGWSEPSPDPRASVTMVAELHRLLENAGEAGPYLLVGHSFGGALVRLYAHTYPDEVDGMVLVDAAHEDLFSHIPIWRRAGGQMGWLLRMLIPLRSLGVLALAPQFIPDRGLPDDALAQYRAILATTRTLETSVAETEAFEDNLADIAAANITSFGDLPLVVISNGQWKPLAGVPGASPEDNQLLWQAMQSKLVALSSQSKQTIAEQSEHFIQLQQPELVIGAIRELVDSIREESGNSQ